MLCETRSSLVETVTLHLVIIKLYHRKAVYPYRNHIKITGRINCARHVLGIIESYFLVSSCILGAVLAVASNDGTVKMYEVANGKVSG